MELEVTVRSLWMLTSVFGKLSWQDRGHGVVRCSRWTKGWFCVSLLFCSSLLCDSQVLLFHSAVVRINQTCMNRTLQLSCFPSLPRLSFILFFLTSFLFIFYSFPFFPLFLFILPSFSFSSICFFFLFFPFAFPFLHLFCSSSFPLITCHCSVLPSVFSSLFPSLSCHCHLFPPSSTFCFPSLFPAFNLFAPPFPLSFSRSAHLLPVIFPHFCLASRWKWTAHAEPVIAVDEVAPNSSAAPWHSPQDWCLVRSPCRIFHRITPQAVDNNI